MKTKNISKNQSIVLLISTLIFITSCQDIIDTDLNVRKTKINNSLLDGVVMPLNVMNNWTYKVRFSDSTMYASNDISTRTLTGDTLIYGELWMKSYPYFYCNKPDGLHAMTVEGWYLGYKDMLYAKYPAQPGDTFSFNNLFCTVVSTDTSITVPAGTFKCYFYHKVIKLFPGDTIDYYTNNQFFCPGIGLIQDEQYVLDNFDEMRSIYQLIEYTIR